MKQRLRRRLWWGAVAGWMALIWWLSDQPHLTSGSSHDWWLRKVAHMVEYAGLTGLWYGAGRQHWRLRPALLVAVVAALAWAGLDEWHQAAVPGRQGAGRDVVIDAAGVAAAALLVIWRRGREMVA